MYSLTLKTPDNSETLLLAAENSIYISNVDGMTGIETQFDEVQTVDGVGTDVTNSGISSKILTITGVILDGNTEKKRALLSMCKPRRELLVAVNLMSDTQRDQERQAKVFVKESPIFTQERHSLFTVSFLMPNPFWTKKTAETIQLAIQDLQTISVEGEADPEFEFRFTPAMAIDSARLQVDDKIIYLNFAYLPAGLGQQALTSDTIRVYRDNGKLKVTLKRGLSAETNIISVVGKQSNLTHLPVGRPSVRLQTSVAVTGYSTASLMYYPLYSGVFADGV